MIASLSTRSVFQIRERLYYRLFREPYLVAVGPRSDWRESFRAHDLRIIRAPRGRFYADPFLVESDGCHYLFVEDADVHTKIGVISCMRISEDGKPSPAVVVLKRSYHLSYPFVFRWSGNFYMIPETEQNATVELYRATEFPWRWELAKELLHNVHAVDSTLLEYKGRFWLFTAMSERSGSLNDELFVFHSGSLFGEWIAHPRNPVVSDAARARPAGAVFMDRGEIIRPGQDCSRIYGGAIVMNRVEVLSETDYCERPLGRIDPDWHRGLLGTHTINRTRRLMVIDGHRAVLRWFA